MRPIIATSILAFSSLTATYLVIGGITLLTYLAFRMFSSEDPPRKEQIMEGDGG